jgi:hypothetical protein
MTNTLDYKIIITLTLSLLLKLTALACSCPGRLTTEQDYKRSDLVIQGRIIGADTIYSSNTLFHDKKGTKIGRHKFSVYTAKFLRIKLVVEKNFKSISNLPDTIYILTSSESDACGYPFTPFLGQGVLPDSYYQYIIYGDKWTEKSIIKYKKRKKYVGQIKETLLGDTFFTSICRRTQSVNEAELNILSKLTH